MSNLEAVFLGIIQGVTEFLPVSSSGHLVLAEHFLDIGETPLAFDVTLHIATLFAVFAYFRLDWLKMFRSCLPGNKAGQEDRKLLGLLVAGTVPGAVAGFLLEKTISETLRSPWVVVCTLAAVAILLWMADRMAASVKSVKDYDLKSAVITGCCQAIAVIPGVSRSGITITAGLFMGFTRTAAARFSFLLSAPIIAGAGFYEGLKLWRQGFPGLGMQYLWGFLAALFTGYFVIAGLMRFLQSNRFTVFIVYRILLAGAVALSLLFA